MSGLLIPYLELEMGWLSLSLSLYCLELLSDGLRGFDETETFFLS
jgi:hypothetical protein